MLALTITAAIAAQSWLVDTHRRSPIVAPNAADSVTVDIDGDGDPDLLIAEQIMNSFPGGLRVWINDGRGNLANESALRVPAGSYNAYSLALGDVDRDGDPDVVLGCLPGPLRLYRNDGAGRFVDVTSMAMPATTGLRSQVRLFDVDRDGDLDLYAAGIELAIVYPNDGTGNFMRLPAQWSFPAGVVTFVVDLDLEGDGDRDLLVGPYLEVLENVNGSLQARPLPIPIARHAAVGDLDGDGDPDIVLAEDGLNNNWRQNFVLVNDGSGRFTPGPFPFDDDRSGFARLADLDADGDLDVFFANRGQSRLLLNDATGRFADVTAARLPYIENDTEQIAFRAHAADFDRDGDLDILHVAPTAQGTCEMLWNLGDARFVADGARAPGHWRYVGGFGHLDADGSPEALTVSFDATAAVIHAYRNDGRGRFASPPQVVSRTPQSPRVTTADIDRDGVDELLVNDALTPRVELLAYRNGTFVDESIRLPANRPASVGAVGFPDIDRDGFVDLVLAADRVYIYRNDGTGHFPQELLVLWQDRPITALAFGDVDGNGSIDIAAGAGNGFDYILLNGGYPFVLRTLPYEPTSDVRAGMALLDFDLDGDLDLVRGHMLSRNDGTGRFGISTGYGAPNALAAGDIDGDGATDLVVAARARLSVFLARRGGWISPTVDQPPFSNLSSLALADTDLDGDLDVLVGSTSGDSMLLTNQARHAFARVGPYVGRSYAIEIAALANANSARSAVFALADAAARVPLPPLGVLGIDLNRAVVLPPVALAAGANGTQLNLPIPGDRSLVGARLYQQAAIADSVAVRLTNTFADVVR